MAEATSADRVRLSPREGAFEMGDLERGGKLHFGFRLPVESDDALAHLGQARAAALDAAGARYHQRLAEQMVEFLDQ
jgi:hypothetical protein